MSKAKRRLSEHEEATITAFVIAGRQERERLLLARGDPDDSIWSHRPPLDPGAMWQVPPQWGVEDAIEELRRRGAPDDVVGIYGQLAGEVVPLSDAMRTVFAARYGDLISLIPGRLAYYDGEWKHGSYVLSR